MLNFYFLRFYAENDAVFSKGGQSMRIIIRSIREYSRLIGQVFKSRTKYENIRVNVFINKKIFMVSFVDVFSIHAQTWTQICFNTFGEMFKPIPGGEKNWPNLVSGCTDLENQTFTCVVRLDPVYPVVSSLKRNKCANRLDSSTYFFKIDNSRIANYMKQRFEIYDDAGPCAFSPQPPNIINSQKMNILKYVPEDISHPLEEVDTEVQWDLDNNAFAQSQELAEETTSKVAELGSSQLDIRQQLAAATATTTTTTTLDQLQYQIQNPEIVEEITATRGLDFIRDIIISKNSIQATTRQKLRIGDYYERINERARSLTISQTLELEANCGWDMQERDRSRYYEHALLSKLKLDSTMNTFDILREMNNYMAHVAISNNRESSYIVKTEKRFMAPFPATRESETTIVSYPAIYYKPLQQLVQDFKPYKAWWDQSSYTMLTASKYEERFGSISKSSSDDKELREERKRFKYMSIFDIWSSWDQRTSFTKIEFDPRAVLKSYQHSAGILNSFAGFRFSYNECHEAYLTEPDNNNCRLIEYHLTEVLANPKENDPFSKNDIANWLLKYFAWTVQRPWFMTGTVLLIHGREGCGKSMWLQGYLSFFLDYVLRLDNKHSIMNRFSHPDEPQAIYLLHEEVCSGGVEETPDNTKQSRSGGAATTNRGSKRVLDQVKAKATEAVSTCETKFANKQLYRNYANQIFCSNHLRPFDFGDTGNRRFLLLSADNSLIADRQYFESLAFAFEGNNAIGLRCFIGKLLSMDLADFDPGSPPRTPYLESMVLKSLKEVTCWWRYCLSKGENVPVLPNDPARNDPDCVDPENKRWSVKANLEMFLEEIKKFQLNVNGVKELKAIAYATIKEQLALFIPELAQLKTLHLKFEQIYFKIPSYEEATRLWNKHFGSSLFIEQHEEEIQQQQNNTAKRQRQQNIRTFF